MFVNGFPIAQNYLIHLRLDRAPQNPVVFCHGLLGFDTISLGPTFFATVQISHWRGIQEVLEANKIEVLVTKVPATSSIDERARVLKDKISSVYPGREVHLIGEPSVICKDRQLIPCQGTAWGA
jgi:triacylglycerol lipase